MLEIHAWATIRFENDSLDKITNCHLHLYKMMEDIFPLNRFDIFKDISLNVISISITIDRNHLVGDIENCLSVFSYIGSISPRSYGILYVFDDENTSGKNNQFQVFILRNSEIQEESDFFLSPYIPTLEEPWEAEGHHTNFLDG